MLLMSLDVATATEILEKIRAGLKVEDIVKGFELGASDYVTKPFDFPVVIARTHTQLELHRTARQLAGLDDTAAAAIADAADRVLQLDGGRLAAST